MIVFCTTCKGRVQSRSRELRVEFHVSNSTKHKVERSFHPRIVLFGIAH